MRQFWGLQGVLACFQVETEMGMYLKISAWSAVGDVLFESTTEWRKDHLSLFSGLVAEKVALLSLCPPIEITRNPITGSCLGFPPLPTAGKEKTTIFILQPLSTHRYQNYLQTASHWVQTSPRSPGGCRYYWEHLMLQQRTGTLARSCTPRCLHPPRSPLSSLDISHPPVPVKVPVPRAAQL